ncbi:Na+/H+ antiporter [Flavobacterium selenitireducens]|uniref:Na+/H+ antiporter n=1 Tax=Flavobacterium selenitireducens TaxID=2722704 RepID=UPI00168B03EA|nr:Na+/H+ antiporter [Flavobacterium selenitireducens]MBD3581158.1 Na+/H+ antiporter [Flavobacterium selenitireducens]
MHHDLLLILGLLFVVMLLVMLAKKLNVAYPIFLVLSGLGVSLIPGMPETVLDPEVIFLIFLPPLLFEAAWYTSWKDFWKWRRPIGLLAFGLVFFTSMAVAYFTNSLIPGFTLALGFLLGGIISPPDAIAAATVLKGLPVPKRLLTILEGESLVNDASSLIVFRFALAAVMTGFFSFEVAVGQFFLVAGMGVVVGLVIAHVMYAIHKFLPTTPAIDATLTVMTPYILFLTAEHFHFSGVMAVVSGGLFISFRSHEIFVTGTTRINMLGVWTTLIFAMNTLVFILIGLELPHIVNGLGEYSIGEGIKYGLLISGIIIVLRFIWVFPAAYVPRMMSAKVRKEPHPGWKGPLVISWAGMRGVVSLATALSIPVTLSNGDAFPYRSLILFITFVVILVTLVFQGLTLPLIVRLIKLREIDPILPEEEQQAGIRLRLKHAALSRLNRKYKNEMIENELVGFLHRDLENQVEVISRKLTSPLQEGAQVKELDQYRAILQDLYAAQRQELSMLRREHFFSDEEIRKAQLQLDLDEAKLVRQFHF